ncbi:MAG: hypothetical protein JSS12_07730 [Verrucomicrobia bacterium]|nr:hypothetical protein [Verrucomicrobiota bacterium]
MYRFVLLFFVMFCPLVADEELNVQEDIAAEVHDDAVPSLVNLTSIPSAVVNGTVNVISGDFVECNQDDIVSGPDPYILGHSYASSSLQEGNLGSGWNFLHYHLLEVYQPDRIEYVKKGGSNCVPYLYPFEMTSAYQQIMGVQPLFPQEVKPIAKSELSIFSHPLDGLNGWTTKDGGSEDPIFLSLYDPSGGRLLYETTYDEDRKDKGMRNFKLVTKNSGITNITHGVLSGQTNLKNIQLKWIRKKDAFHVTLGDGTLRVYERQWWRKDMRHKRPYHSTYYRDYHLTREYKPNGNVSIYYYNGDFAVTAIETYNKDQTQKLSWVWFDQKDKSSNPSLIVKTSDERTHSYTFERLDGSPKHGKYTVSSLIRQGKPVVRFEYQEQGGKRRLVKKMSEDGSWIRNEYYKNGRVKQQSSPIGPNGAEVVTHRYFYKKEEDGSGRCTVLDAHNNRTRYYWDKHKRLVGITRLNEQKQLLMHEQFYWSKTHSYNKGNLRAHVVKDENDKIRFVRKFNYDGRGNVLEDILLACITKDEGKIKFKDDLTHFETCDRIVTSYTYSKDGLNLKTSECDPLGNYTYYEYYPGTNLLKAKFVCDKKQIKKREFFAYDDCAILTEHIVDDGTLRNKESFDAVTERRITCITPRRELPHFGEPQEISGFYFDCITKGRVLCKKTINHFNEKGLVVHKKVYDRADNAVCYEFAYDEAGRLVETKDPMGGITRVVYDPQTGRIVERNGPRDDLRTLYAYDAMGKLLKEKEVYADGLELATEYEYDFLGRKISTVDQCGNKTHYAYDALNRCTTITYPDIYDHLGNVITPTKSYSYNALGAVVTEKDEIGLVTITKYNALGKITESNLPNGACKKYSYDVMGNLVAEIAPNGTITQMSYDSFGRITSEKQLHADTLLSESSLVYNTFHKLKEVGPSGETVEYAYDASGLLQSCTQEGRSTQYSYDPAQRLSEERKLLENGFIAKSYLYDDLNRVVDEKLFDHTSDLRSYKSYTYDVEGNQSSISQNISGKEAKTLLEYRPHRLPEKHIDAEGNITYIMYNFRELNSHGQRVLCKKTVDPAGCVTEELYDARGNLAQVCRFDPMYQLIAKKELFYDAASNLIRVDEHAISQIGVNTITTLFKYTNGHLTAITEAADTPEEKTTVYRYNSFGELEATVCADGTVLYNQYDDVGRLARYYSQDLTIDYSYSYDSSDRVVQVQNGFSGSTTHRSYNSFGEIAAETLETGLKLDYEYDLAGRRQKLTLPDGSSVHYAHSAFLDSVTRVSSDGKPIYTHAITSRDLSGLIEKTQLPGKAGEVNYTRDARGITTQIVHKAFEEKAVKIDALGNLLGLQTKDPQGAFERSFTYDFLSQLTSENDHEYSYDSLYNRLEHNGKQYAVNNLHSVSSDGTRSFEYDKRGNRILMKAADGDTSYRYDALDRLIEVRTQDSCYTYTYDAFNRRLSKKSGLLEQKFIYDLDNEIGSVDENNAITELRVLAEGLGAEIGASVALEVNDSVYIPLHDRQGSVVVLLDLEGMVKESYRYDAFGNKQTEDLPISPWGFASKRYDPETGFVYFGRRYYDASLGKWLTQDPLGLKAGPNLYAYLLNNPLSRFDEYGLYVEDERDRPRNTARVVYTASYGMLHDRDSSSMSDYRSESSRNDHPMYSSFWDDKTYVVALTEPQTFEEEDESVDWGRILDAALDSVDDAFLAADIGGYALIVAGPGYTKLTGVGLKAISWAGRACTRCVRTIVKNTVSVRQARQVQRCYTMAVQGGRTTTDFIWAEVSINGKLTEGWVDVGSTIKRVNKGIPDLHVRDGSIFKNIKSPLPIQGEGYYREYVVRTPGVYHPGKQRLVTGGNGELYYTPDHYVNFTKLN